MALALCLLLREGAPIDAKEVKALLVQRLGDSVSTMRDINAAQRWAGRHAAAVLAGGVIPAAAAPPATVAAVSTAAAVPVAAAAYTVEDLTCAARKGVAAVAGLAMPLLRVAHNETYGPPPPAGAPSIGATSAPAPAPPPWLPLAHACVWSNVTTTFVLPSSAYLTNVARRVPGYDTFRPANQPLMEATKANWEMLARADARHEPHVGKVGKLPLADNVVQVADEDLAAVEAAVWGNALAHFPRVRFPASRTEAYASTAPVFFSGKVDADKAVLACTCAALGLPAAAASVPADTVAAAAKQLVQANHIVRHAAGSAADPVTVTDVVRVLVQACKFAATVAGQWTAWKRAPPSRSAALVTAEECDAGAAAAVTAAGRVADELALLLRGHDSVTRTADGDGEIVALLAKQLGVGAAAAATAAGGSLGAGPIRVVLAPPHHHPAGALCAGRWDVLLDLSSDASLLPPAGGHATQSLTASMAAAAAAGIASRLPAGDTPEDLVATGRCVLSAEDVKQSWAGGLAAVRRGLQPRIFAPLVRAHKSSLLQEDGATAADADALITAVRDLARAVEWRSQHEGIRIAVTVLAYAPCGTAVLRPCGMWAFESVDLHSRVRRNLDVPLLMATFMRALPETAADMLVLTDRHGAACDHFAWLCASPLAARRWAVMTVPPSLLELRASLGAAVPPPGVDASPSDPAEKRD